MRRLRFIIGLGLTGLLATTRARADDFFDRVDDALTVSAFHDFMRMRVSGTLDFEAYSFSQPPLGLIESSGQTLFNPRLALFLDAQIGQHLYAFVQARADRSFDPSNDDLRAELEEYALRYTPWNDSRFNFQIGQFASVVGNWIPRHGSWENPFVTAPLPYENLTGIWDSMAARSVGQLLSWAHVGAFAPPAGGPTDKYQRNPVIWGPSYTSGAAIFGQWDKIEYSAEVKNRSLSSRPDYWAVSRVQWQNPTFTGRISYRPNEMWTYGFSASTGSYLLPSAEHTLAPGYTLGDYRESILGQDIAFAWHHFQFWAECYEARFAIPLVAEVETVAYYLEAKYKFTPQFFAALRWNQQLFSDVTEATGQRTPWGRDVWRIDFAPGYRFTPHTQLKLQYSWQHENSGPPQYSRLLALQLTVRF